MPLWNVVCPHLPMATTIYSKEHKRLIEQLKQARLAVKLDQRTAAKLLHRTQSYISKIEAGQRRIDVVALKGFAQIYKKPIDYFLK